MSTLRAFPSITEPEFAEACKALESRSLDRLDGTDWLSVRWSGEELIIKQRRNGGIYGQEGCDRDSDQQGNGQTMEAVEDTCHETV